MSVWRRKIWDGEEEEEDEPVSGRVEAPIPTCLHGRGGGSTAIAEASVMATGEGSATDTGEPHIIPGYARGSRGSRAGGGPSQGPLGIASLTRAIPVTDTLVGLTRAAQRLTLGIGRGIN